MRLPLEGLANQTLIGLTTERATYVGLVPDEPLIESTPTVLIFSESRLSVENPYEVRSPQGGGLQNLIGLSVKEAFSTEEELRLIFEDGGYLSVSLRDSDFRSPEAAVYAPAAGAIVVFN
jgi:hypothetical protein